MEEEPNKTNSTTLSLEIADIYTFVATLSEELETLKNQKNILQKQLEDVIKNPPLQQPSIQFNYSDFSKQYNESITSIQKERDMIEVECKELQKQVLELTNQNLTFKENFSNDLSFLQTKVQQLDILIQSLILIPETLIKEETNSDLNEVENINKNNQIINELKQSISDIDVLKTENQTLREKIQTLIVQNNKLSEALETIKKKQENERKIFNEKESIYQLEAQQWKENIELEKESKVVVRKCQNIQDCLNLLVSSWKNTESMIINNVNMEIEKELKEVDNIQENKVEQQQNEKKENEEKVLSQGLNDNKQNNEQTSSDSEKNNKINNNKLNEESTSIKNEKNEEGTSQLTNKKSDVIEISDESKVVDDNNMSEENLEKVDLL
ncbi:hypothetical protein EHI8A_041980 [Entamoeba histolytica HM-1:IMSS-B]|uniref:Uncharacterized protein n=6 Tax=Entamoeba histolytica TaxID=5759 RepID=C4MAI8_ENTH1|nr:hypothetical protein EHI_196600 [Entamoeba histolytica HM-1:IMSS]EMD48153.1 Hypothetical protein EHI5A_074330 [Entamoeba histolytica KU27]EMH78061.1 hypothetical protein EHI8A_041980 [Entamoeba histolytica HM-1:IMSS-B]EMS12710.1 hypothetical protein KM1_087170 [Entamoeba histolytica HM-3:IMSS]ENY64231.1 hypothetical protein EHI7A_103260 [Entamoeba histolytica HM-1:IMSS-A]GAT98824.1 hypothetical protein CL6EHI_196600 [Entamoeba histolytica]|eukprot:XP_648917.1 hypothetical protein EHI_196600 [Entamoeba histolytica HM-1:IMSS]